MKFFEFPQLVKIEILQTMRLGELFLLSFASKRTRETIKSLYPKSDTEIVMEIDNEKVLVKTANRTEMVLRQHMDTPNYEERLEMLTSGQCHIVVRLGRSVYVFSDAEDVVLKMHKYLSDLINSKSAAFLKLVDLIRSVHHRNGYNQRYLESQIMKVGKETRKLRIKNNLVNCFRRYYNREPMDEKEWEMFLVFLDIREEDRYGYSKRCPSVSLIMDDSAGVSRVEKAVFNCTFWPNPNAYFRQFSDLKFCMINNGDAPVTRHCSAINNVEDLIVRQPGREFSSLLLSFQGQNAFLEDCHLDEDHLSAFGRFLKLWMSGQRETLKTFIAFMGPLSWYNPADYLTIDAKEEGDPKKRGRYYPYESIITDHHKFPADTFDCKDGVDIVRDWDGRRATVKMTPQHFMFFVWPQCRAEN